MSLLEMTALLKNEESRANIHHFAAKLCVCVLQNNDRMYNNAIIIHAGVLYSVTRYRFTDTPSVLLKLVSTPGKAHMRLTSLVEVSPSVIARMILNLFILSLSLPYSISFQISFLFVLRGISAFGNAICKHIFRCDWKC